MAVGAYPGGLLAEQLVPVGAAVLMPEQLPDDFTRNGARFLRSGFFETDPALYDAAIWSEAFVRGVRLSTELAYPSAATAQTVHHLSFSQDGMYGAAVVSLASGAAAAKYFFTTRNYGETWTYRGNQAPGGSTFTSKALHMAPNGKAVAILYHDNGGGSTRTYFVAIDAANPTSALAVNTPVVTAQPSDVYSVDGTTWFMVASSSNTSGNNYRSTDGGATWTGTAINASFNTARLHSHDGTVWLITQGASTGTTIQRSTDSGATWSSVTLWGGAATTHAVKTVNGTTWYAVGSRASVIAKSTDSGATWAEIATQTAASGFARVFVSADGSKLAIIGSSSPGKNQYSVDSGATWTTSTFTSTIINTGTPEHGARSGGRSDEDLFVFLTTTAAYTSSDYGQTWNDQTYRLTTQGTRLNVTMDDGMTATRMMALGTGPNHVAGSAETVSPQVLSIIAGAGGMAESALTGYDYYVRIS